MFLRKVFGNFLYSEAVITKSIFGLSFQVFVPFETNWAANNPTPWISLFFTLALISSIILATFVASAFGPPGLPDLWNIGPPSLTASLNGAQQGRPQPALAKTAIQLVSASNVVWSSRFAVDRHIDERFGSSWIYICTRVRLRPVVECFRSSE